MIEPQLAKEIEFDIQKFKEREAELEREHQAAVAVCQRRTSLTPQASPRVRLVTEAGRVTTPTTSPTTASPPQQQQQDENWEQGSKKATPQSPVINAPIARLQSAGTPARSV